MKKVVEILIGQVNHIINKVVSIKLSKSELGKIIKKSGKNDNPEKISLWKQKWSVFGHVNEDYYRVFSKYVGEDINIVPDDISHNYICPLLNPKRFIGVYEDKNMFDRFLKESFGRNITPPTYIRCMGGALYDVNYRPLEEICNIAEITDHAKCIVAKQSLDSSSGRGVLFYNLSDGRYVNSKDGSTLSVQELIDKLGKNFIVQKRMKQSSFMDSFCSSSVNTLRVAVYRSVKDNSPHVINTIIRIGKQGSLVDNAHAGGMFVGVDETGTLGPYCCNQYGETYKTFNDIDFSQTKMVIPNYDKVKKFAEKISLSLPHLRLLALDVMLDENNEPVLIEYNIKAFSCWLFQFTNGSVFGKYTDEIIEYCKHHKEEASRIFVSF